MRREFVVGGEDFGRNRGKKFLYIYMSTFFARDRSDVFGTEL